MADTFWEEEFHVGLVQALDVTGDRHGQVDQVLVRVDQKDDFFLGHDGEGADLHDVIEVLTIEGAEAGGIKVAVEDTFPSLA